MIVLYSLFRLMHLSLPRFASKLIAAVLDFKAKINTYVLIQIIYFPVHL